MFRVVVSYNFFNRKLLLYRVHILYTPQRVTRHRACIFPHSYFSLYVYKWNQIKIEKITICALQF